ncbi:hypothetical protein AVEN_61959-1 [Araneus ventricosus]|uniref:Uncharacterized protein n=1 Tax=Araneus ventricosus TaxID=182803 RepID=A0A4Y2SPE1_ARAVE|nr:hypothetical protein AVEN_61959-1 [Araneus ventricosus]
MSVYLSGPGYKKSRSLGSCFDVPSSKYSLSPLVSTQRIVVARGFVGWLKSSMSVNARTSKEVGENLHIVPPDCCRLYIYCRKDAASQIPTSSKSPTTEPRITNQRTRL